MNSPNWINKKEFGKFYIEQLEDTPRIALLTLNDHENRFNNGNIESLNQLLDYVENNNEIGILITTSTDPKHYSLDNSNKDNFLKLLYDMSIFFERFLTLPIVTISCINGHSFGGGAFFSLVHDFRVMNMSKGFFCVNAIQNKVPLPPGLISIAKEKISDPSTLRNFLLLGQRFGGTDAEKFKLVDKACSNYLEESITLAKSIDSKDRLTYGSLKTEIYKSLSESLKDKDLGEAYKVQVIK
ncbi:hypothetical protein DICPUDRAFT_87255 [Dictyostelium purpureum]|uniref:Enoyl-CoA hydratase n=1 Tax=Dictyostelium purpureum TaxID=5786 RepID=F0ZGY3_DICPU|nr:uncharacterized protein DICPUDRAFT_87255 [Dictyostelium purpureum]EGC36793.1 hypothetical protein DICPUDRAFT_87255 [Dictyostelium purpureum]|eukprot:XP_003286664.1 hypothetical protein DICPUDRAFT_87255 [Dictyostelium purpureum]